MPLDSQGLPDGRVYEMVTPANDLNANVYVPRASSKEPDQGVQTTFLFQPAKNGSAVAYIADPTTPGFGQSGRGLGNQYLATRLPAGGWRQFVEQPAGRKASIYQAFSENLSTGILNSGNPNEPSVPPLTTEAPSGGYFLLYACSGAQRACTVENPGEHASENPFRAVFNVTPPNRTTLEFGAPGTYVAAKSFGAPLFAGGNEDLSEIFFEADDALVAGSGELESELDNDVKEEIAKGEASSYLYSSSEGRLSLVDVSPDGRVVRDASFGAGSFTAPRNNPADFSGAVSDDGRRAYWSDGEGAVFLRLDGERTVQVSEGPARYWTSAADGRYALYTEGGGLYRFDSEASSSSARLQLVPKGDNVLGLLGVGDDGEATYFVSEAAFQTGPSSEGAVPQEGQPNLYFLINGRPPVFIATLSLADGNAVQPFAGVAPGEFGDWQPGLGQRTARVTSDGQALVFMSNQSLATAGFPHGYENQGQDEVYLYDASSNRLNCVSCSATGEAPSGEAFLPISWSNLYLPQWVSEDGGRVFFDSSQALVPQDTSGRQEVYEWERPGVGTCTTGNEANGGCIYLLSSGESEADSWLVGASELGEDAFIVTRAQLSGRDQNGAFDLYDARVGGEVPVEEPACTGTGCQGVPAPPPSFATPASITFNGVGNLSPPPRKSKAKKRTAGRAHPVHRRSRSRVCRRRGRRTPHRKASCATSSLTHRSSESGRLGGKRHA